MRLLLTLITVSLFLIVGMVFLVKYRQAPTPAEVSTPEVTIPQNIPPVENLPEPELQKPTVYFPIDNYNNRLTNRGFGKLIAKNDNEAFPCGAPFSGYHTGDDLEITNNEVNSEIPIYAIAAGTVRQAGIVGGYGGLIVIEHQLGSQTITAYYGHINLDKTSVKKGDSVTPGQKISVLGDQCSAQTNNERKHIHFGIHKGTGIDVKGYVSTQEALQNWLDPRVSFNKLNAADPKK